MIENTISELPIRGETGVVDVVDVIAVDRKSKRSGRPSSRKRRAPRRGRVGRRRERKGGPSTMSGDGIWIDEEFNVACRPLSQHGSFCRISPTRNGLRVRVFAIKYDDPHTGLLVEDFIARRCAK